MAQDDYGEILNLLHDYSAAIDRKDWKRLEEEVLAPDADLDFVTWRTRTAAEAATKIRGFLEPCGKTQHLLGSYRVEIDGERAKTRCYVRAFHVGAGEHEGTTYEMAGEYIDELRRLPQGWRIAKRRGRMHFESGNRALLGPENSGDL